MKSEVNIIDYGLGLLSGLLASPFVAWRISRRLVCRMTRHLTMEVVAAELERRREAIDSGRDTDPPVDAGPAGNVVELFSVRPGQLHQSHLRSKKPENSSPNALTHPVIED
jgi:hypothetical protein